MDKKQPLVAIVMGSNSDWPTMKNAAQVLADFEVPYKAEVISAHRTPDQMMAFAEGAAQAGYQIIIAGAGGAAHLPGMIASKTILPVLGVPVATKYLQGQDSLLSIVQMPKGVPVATFAIGDAGATNAGLFAISLLANQNVKLSEKLKSFRQQQIEKVNAMELNDKP